VSASQTSVPAPRITAFVLMQFVVLHAMCSSQRDAWIVEEKTVPALQIRTVENVLHLPAAHAAQLASASAAMHVLALTASAQTPTVPLAARRTPVAPAVQGASASVATLALVQTASVPMATVLMAA